MQLEKKHEILDNIDPKTLSLFRRAIDLQFVYHSAIREVQTKLEILDDEFHARYDHNPIHHIESRLKSPASIIEKLQRKGHEVSIESAKKNLQDIAGIRVICNYIEDVYTIAELLLKQDDITLLRRRDYIVEPKVNGYRSLHLIVQIPVFLAETKELIPVEIQIRTIGMDFWASLEHQLRYKSEHELSPSTQAELQECASIMNDLDHKMQNIRHLVD